MTQCNTLNVKLSNSQLNNIKSAIKDETEVVLNLLSKWIGNSNDETYFPHKLLWIYTKDSKIRKDFTNASSAKISKTLRIFGKNMVKH